MTRLSFDKFRGLQPLIAPRFLPPGYAVEATNCDFRRGRLEPLAGLGAPTALSQPGSLQSIFPIAPGQWLAWPHPTSVVRLPVAAGNGRIAFTGPDYPKQTDLTLATTGAPSTWPTTTRRLGVQPPPSTAPLTVEIIGDAGQDTLATISYCYALVTDWGEESDTGPLTGVFTVYTGQSTKLTGFDHPLGNGNNYTHYRIYRLDASDTTAEYLFLADIAITATEYYDDVAIAAGPDALVTTGYLTPPDGLDGMLQYHDTVVIWKGQDLRLSPLRTHYAFPDRPPGHRHQMAEAITGAGWFGETLVVFTGTREHRFHGKDPAYISRENPAFTKGCVAMSSVANSPHGVYAAGATGLILSGPDGSPLVSGSLFTPEQWAALTPANLLGFFWRDGYLAFRPGTNLGFHLTPANHEVVALELPTGHLVRGGYHDQATDIIHLLIETPTGYQVFPWATDNANPLPAIWQSGPLRTAPDTALSAAKITGQGTTATLTLVVDGETVMDEIAVPLNEIIRLPLAACGMEWQPRIETTVPIDRLVMATSTEELE